MRHLPKNPWGVRTHFATLVSVGASAQARGPASRALQRRSARAGATQLGRNGDVLTAMDSGGLLRLPDAAPALPERRPHDAAPGPTLALRASNASAPWLLYNDSAASALDDLLYRHSAPMTAVYCAAYSVVFMLGLVGNSCVIAVVWRSPRMRTVTNLFIANLAAADLLVVVFCLPATLLGNIFVREYLQ